MPIRPAKYSDLIPATRILARAFQDEYLFGTFMHPHRTEYPDDMYLWFLHKLRTAYVSGPDDQIFVAYEADDHGQEQITGLAHWHRLRVRPSHNIYEKAMAHTLQWYNYLESFIYPNRAADPLRANVLAEAGPYVAHHWTGTRAECWDLSLLGVDPNRERQGIGRELVKLGFDKAKQEGVGCSVISAEGKERFYQSCGFDEIVGRASDEGGDANPLRGIPGGIILFWDNGREVVGVRKYGVN